MVSVDEVAGLTDVNNRFRFWGESGHVGEDKVFSLARRFPHMHFAIAKWEKNLTPLEQMVRDRTAPFDLLRFQTDDLKRFIDNTRNVALSHADLSQWIRISPDKT